MPHVRCATCGVAKAALWIGPAPKSGCIRQEAVNGGMCDSIHIEVLQYALRRAVAPQCFDERGFIRSGMLAEALKSQQAAMRSAAAIHGPFVQRPDNHEAPQ